MILNRSPERESVLFEVYFGGFSGTWLKLSQVLLLGVDVGIRPGSFTLRYLNQFLEANLPITMAS